MRSNNIIDTRIKDNQILVFKTLNSYHNIYLDIICFFKITATYLGNAQSGLGVRKYSYSPRIISVQEHNRKVSCKGDLHIGSYAGTLDKHSCSLPSSEVWLGWRSC